MIDRLKEFLHLLPTSPRVLEVGTKRWHSVTTRREAWCKSLLPSCVYTGSDAQPGVDVDVVADIHQLERVFTPASFDLMLLPSILEHVEKPWVAAESIARVMTPGGLVWAETHQSFPLHYYPSDYWRFTTEALAVLFCPPSWAVLASGYSYPAKIIPPEEVKVWNPEAPMFLNVWCVAQRQ